MLIFGYKSSEKEKGDRVMIDKEILWEKISQSRFSSILEAIGRRYVELISRGIHFETRNLRFNLKYGDRNFDALLAEKFNITDCCHCNVSCLYFIHHDGSFGFELPYRNYGYIDAKEKHAIVFADSFGIFKSVISGFASFLLQNLGYKPSHASVLVTEKQGVIFSGGYMAGKTTTLINLVDYLLKDNMQVGILTDDWAVLSKKHGKYIAETFDHSVSFNEKTVQENRHITFCRSNKIKELIGRQTKFSITPEQLSSSIRKTTEAEINKVVILDPHPGKSELQKITNKEFAQEMIDAAYHYPYIRQGQIYRHYNFWLELAKEIQVFKFATRSASGHFQNLEPLWRLLK